MMPADKLLHLLAGIAIAAVVYPFGVIPALLAVILAAVGKELWYAQGHGTPDHIDALATVAGGCAMLGWLLLMAPLITKII